MSCSFPPSQAPLPYMNLESTLLPMNDKNDAQVELTQLFSTLEKRRTAYKWTSRCLWPCTCPLTCVIGCIAAICIHDNNYFAWKCCKSETECMGINPWTGCITDTKKGLIAHMATDEEKQRYRELHEIIIRGRSRLNHT